MQKRSFNINNLGLKIPHQHGNQKDSNYHIIHTCGEAIAKYHIIHNWGEAIAEVETQNLAVPTGHQLSSKHTISLDHKHPFAFDTYINDHQLSQICYFPFELRTHLIL
jgi:hypothetical protein